MDKVRGILMLGVGVFALIRGLVTHREPNAWVLAALGVLAIALGVWHIARKPPQRLK